MDISALTGSRRDPMADYVRWLLDSAAVMICFSPVAVGLRFISRRMTKVPLMADDWLILMALPFTMTVCAIDIAGVTKRDFGQRLLFLDPIALRTFLQFTFAFEVLYNFAITLTKLSILALYWRVFGLATLKWPLITTSIITILFFVGCTGTVIFSCTPVSDFWNRPYGGTCINHIKYYTGQAAVNITLDVALMLLPLISIRKLNMSRLQKVGAAAIFSTGIFVTICSALRLHNLVASSKRLVDPTRALVNAATWSVIEVGMGVVCVCLPSMRPLFRVLFKGRFESLIGSSAGWNNSRRSRLDSVVAANQQRRSGMLLSKPVKGVIIKEQRTDVDIATASSEIELGYYATATVTRAAVRNGDGVRDGSTRFDATSCNESLGGESVEEVKIQKPTSWLSETSHDTARGI